MSRTGNHAQRLTLFVGTDRAFSDTPRGQALGGLLSLRCHRAWIKPGCYAWWRYSDDIERAQKKLAALRAAPCDSGSDPQGENSRSEVEGEASQSGAEGNRPPLSTERTPHAL